MPLDVSQISDPALHPNADKVLSGIPLSHADGLTLYSTPDIHTLGPHANHVREQLHGNLTYYNRNRLHSTVKQSTPYEARVCYRQPIALVA